MKAATLLASMALVLSVAWMFFKPFSQAPDPGAAEVRGLTHSRIRVVWVQDHGNNADVFAEGSRLKLMGYDSADRKGEREILSATGSYARPLLTPGGDRVIFTDCPAKEVCIVNWNGQGLARIGTGRALDAWRDPKTGVDWVYVQDGQESTKPFDEHPVYRIRLDKPGERELVWNAAPVSRDNFQVSADGKMAGGLFPWPNGGVADIEAGKVIAIGRGCWTSFSPDNSYISWIFDGSHRTLRMRSHRTADSWRVRVDTAPEIGGAEVYHPRWSNHPRFMAVSGPYRIRRGSNNIRGGGPDVEIFVGRFNEDFTAIDGWDRITANDRADFFPDVWVEPGMEIPVTHGRGARATAPAAAVKQRKAGGMPVERVDVKGLLLEATDIPDLESIAPYTSALVVHCYQVRAEDLEKVASPSILVAHWGIVNKKTVLSPREVGKEYALSLEPFDSRPELEAERRVMTVDDILLPLYYDVTRE